MDARAYSSRMFESIECDECDRVQRCEVDSFISFIHCVRFFEKDYNGLD